MKNKTQIVRANEKHLKGAVDMWVRLMTHIASNNLQFKLYSNSIEIARQILNGIVKDDRQLLLVAVSDNEVIGGIACQIKPREQKFDKPECGFIRAMEIHFDYRGSGIADSLLNEAYTWFRKMGVDSVDLLVDCKNDVGVAFWKKHGFESYMYVQTRKL